MFHALGTILVILFLGFLVWLESNVRDSKRCPNCDGDGFIPSYSYIEPDDCDVKTCPHCGGSGLAR